MACKVLLLVSFPVPALQTAASNKILVGNCPRWWGLSSEPSKHDVLFPLFSIVTGLGPILAIYI